MKQKTSSDNESRSGGDLRFICIGLVLLAGVIICVSFLEHKQRETAAAPQKHESIVTEIPAQRIRCVKPGHNFCLEYQVFNEVRQ